MIRRIKKLFPERGKLDPEILKYIETAEKIITQFDEIDRKSQVFRYPIDTTGWVTVPPLQFDLVRLKGMLGYTSQFLDGWSTWYTSIKMRIRDNMVNNGYYGDLTK